MISGNKFVDSFCKSLNTKNVPCKDKIAIKLVKLPSNFLSLSLIIAINNSLASSNSLYVTKLATVVRIDKKMVNKYYVSNFRSVS